MDDDQTAAETSETETISAWLAVRDGHEIAWSQLHVTYAGDTGEDHHCGWVDVQVSQLQDATRCNWVWTLNGGIDDLLDTADFATFDGDPYRTIAHADGWRLYVDRGDATGLWLDHDREVHTVCGPDGLSVAHVVVDVGVLPTSAQHAHLARAWEGLGGDDRHYRVERAWSSTRINAALALWARAFAGADVTFAFTRDMAPPGYLLEALSRAADIDAGVANTIPACEHTWQPADAVDGERPRTCVWPATFDTQPPDGREAYPVCDEHADERRAAGWTTTRRG